MYAIRSYYETPTTNKFKDHISFEKEVIKSLNKLNIKTILPAEERDLGYDLIAIVDNRKIAIEIKSWRNRPPFALIRQVIYRLSESMKKHEITEGVIVAKETYGLNDKLKIEENIKFLSIHELRKLMK